MLCRVRVLLRPLLQLNPPSLALSTLLCEMQLGYIYLQDHYACWLSRIQFFTLVNMNMDYISCWGENHRHIFNKGFNVVLSFFVFSCCLIRCTYAKKNEYVRIVYYQHFDFVSTFVGKKNRRHPFSAHSQIVKWSIENWY